MFLSEILISAFFTSIEGQCCGWGAFEVILLIQAWQILAMILYRSFHANKFLMIRIKTCTLVLFYFFIKL